MWSSCAANSLQQKSCAGENISEQAENRGGTCRITEGRLNVILFFCQHLPVSKLVCSCSDSSPPAFCPTKERSEWIHLLPLPTRKLHFTVYFALFLLRRVVTALAENKDKNGVTFVKEQNMQLRGCPLVLQDKVAVSTGCSNLDQKITCISGKTESDTFLPGHYFSQS